MYAQKLSALRSAKDTGPSGGDVYSFTHPNNAMMVAEDTSMYGKIKQKYDFPYGIYFGSRIKDSVKNRVGCVVGVKKDYILVAFEGDVEPHIVAAGVEFFEKGYYLLA